MSEAHTRGSMAALTVRRHGGTSDETSAPSPQVDTLDTTIHSSKEGNDHVTHPSSLTYEVRLPAFEGPLDLLLQLVERNSLPITDVALAQVTESYLQRVEQLDVSAEEMSHFLSVASRLLLLKSRHLLPRPVVEAPDPSSDELADQLRIYRQFKRAAAALRDLEGYTSYLQFLPPPPPDTGEVTATLPATALERALRRALQRAERHPPEGPPVPGVRLRLADVVQQAECILRREGSVSLDRLAGNNPGRRELIVAFLATLDLLRRGRARATQPQPFGPVTLYPLEGGAT